MFNVFEFPNFSLSAFAFCLAPRSPLPALFQFVSFSDCPWSRPFNFPISTFYFLFFNFLSSIFAILLPLLAPLPTLHLCVKIRVNSCNSCLISAFQLRRSMFPNFSLSAFAFCLAPRSPLPAVHSMLDVGCFQFLLSAFPISTFQHFSFLCSLRSFAAISQFLLSVFQSSIFNLRCLPPAPGVFSRFTSLAAALAPDATAPRALARSNGRPEAW